MKQLQSQWNKGINKRVSDRRGDPQRLSELVNARLQERGSTLEVSRIKGYEVIQTIADSQSSNSFFDALMYDNVFVVLWAEQGVGGKVTLTNVDTAGVQTFNLPNIDTTFGKLTLLEDTIFITPYNKQLNFIDGTWRLNDFISTTPIINSITTIAGGNLDQNEDYWYKVRYRYFDGHITKASYPQKVETDTTNRTTQITISTEVDLDGELVETEVYRKRGAEDFFLIDRSQPSVDPYVFNDDGKPNLAPFEDENYVWSQQSRTQEFVRDRIVRAGNSYDSNDDSSEFNISINTAQIVGTGEQVLPTHTDIEVYNKVRKEDGTTGFFKLQDTVSTAIYPSTRLGYRQTGVYDGLFKENALYARFRPKESPDNIAFNSLEIYNSNVPSIETQADAEAEQDKPINPHIFLGWKYLQYWKSTADVIDAICVHDGIWYDNAGGGVEEDVIFRSVAAGDPPFPNVVNDIMSNGTVNIGQSLPYKKKYEAINPNGSGRNSAIYELALLEPLKEAVRQGKLKVRFKGGNNISGSLSTNRPDSEFINFEAKVLDIVDKTAQDKQVTEGQEAGLAQDNLLKSSGQNHLYLVLETGTPFDDFDNLNANNSGVKSTGTIPDVSHRYEFELVGLRTADNTDSTTTTATTGGPLDYTYDVVDYDYRVVNTDYTDLENESAILLKTLQTNQVEGSTTIFDNMGWEKIVNNKFEFFSFNEWNILENVIVKDDLRQFEQEYPNQLIWSQSFIPRSNASKVRNFEFTNFKNISADFGKIVDIQYIQNVLLVFCERGVNLTNVGEVLTQQAGGEVFVDTSRFLTSDYWILKNVPNIQPKSIKQYENMLFFSDGRDVWKYEQGLENISHGAIEIGGIASPSCVSCASIDPLNKEYRISTPNGTWAYSIELGQWMGPHTFKDSISAPYRDRMFSVVGDKVVEHNKGFTFEGQSYNTIIAGVANSLDDPSITKLFRKFYIETQPTNASASLEYGKDENINTTIALQSKPNKNGIYHVGINGANKNGRYLSWKITTTDDNFILSSVGFLLEPKKRR